MKTSFPFNDLWLRSIPGAPTHWSYLLSFRACVCFGFAVSTKYIGPQHYSSWDANFTKPRTSFCVCRQCIFHFPTPASCPVVCAWPTELKFAAFQLALLGMNAGLKLIDCQS